ncbi:MAG: hypothetical protein DMF76_03055 [Acidobacteria bacterium]|nr:MAG: hypothetical protein DMF76_03055 [Acidobacteriota bacterium]
MALLRLPTAVPSICTNGIVNPDKHAGTMRHFHRCRTERFQIAGSPRGGQTANEEGRRHGASAAPFF